MDPDFLASLGLVADGGLTIASLLLREQVIADGNHAGPTRANTSSPDFLWRRPNPVTELDTTDCALAITASKAGPIGRDLNQWGTLIGLRCDPRSITLQESLFWTRRPSPAH